MKRVVKAFTVTGPTFSPIYFVNYLARDARKAFSEFLNDKPWSECAAEGWRVVPCLITYDDGRASKPRRGKGASRG